jgi:2',3'-cyclic-nucleotide 2'-phosphodiesterase (5'-nucleotidase family)
VPYTLQILHASDFEAGLLATQRAGNFAAIVDWLEDTTPNSITLSTGDAYIPSPFFIAGGDAQLNATYRGVYNQFFGLTGANAYGALTASAGRADITIQNFIGIQAAVFGNHEFDATPTEVRNIIGANLGARPGAADDVWVGSFFPYLSTNLNFSRDTGTSGTADLVAPGVAPNASFAFTGPTSTQTGVLADKIAKSTVITENGERILFVGATTQINPLITSLGAITVEGFSGRDDIPLLAQQINAEIDSGLAANPGINKVIVGTHLQQLANEQALAPLLRNADVLIYGGSHVLSASPGDRLLPGEVSENPYPQLFTNASGQPIVLIGTAGEYSYVGRLNVTFDDNGVVVPSSILTGGPATGAGQSGAVAVDDSTALQLFGSRGAAFAPGSKGFLVQQVIEGLDVNNDGVQETLGVADVIRQQDGNILGRTSVYLEGRRTEVRTEESNLGNLTADANLFYGKQFDSRVAVSIKMAVVSAIRSARSRPPGAARPSCRLLRTRPRASRPATSRNWISATRSGSTTVCRCSP